MSNSSSVCGRRPARFEAGLAISRLCRGNLLWLSVLWLSEMPTAALADEPAANQLSAQEISEGWILLFDGQSTFGWQPTSQANWQVTDGTLAVSEGQPGFLTSTSEFSDFELRVDFRATPLTNSGIFLRTVLDPQDPARDCYELNIADPAVSPFSTGSLVGRRKAEPVAADAAWHQFHVTAAGSRFRVRLDGREVLDYTDPAPLGRGRIALQYNQGAVAFRNVKLRPLGLEPLLDGRDLAGWNVYPNKTSKFSITPEGWLHVEDGNGQLESERTFGDFVLQVDVLVGGRGLNSGIFFRNIPGEFWQGYESQIHNGYLRGDRGQPADFGTGGFYRRQKARRVVADDNAWFTKTLVVSGPHMAAWVNGQPVSDWTDDRAPSDNPRQGLRLAPGTLAIQGHDRTTNLSFRGMRAGELRPRQPSGP